MHWYLLINDITLYLNIKPKKNYAHIHRHILTWKIKDLKKKETCIICYKLAFSKSIWSENVYSPQIPMGNWFIELSFINIYTIWCVQIWMWKLKCFYANQFTALLYRIDIKYNYYEIRCGQNNCDFWFKKS